jgi:hypothetical protein
MDALVTTGFEPTAPERTRSTIAAARSSTISSGTNRQVLVGAHSVDDQGHVVVPLPSDCRVAADLAHASSEGLPTVLEFTDLAPISVRDRVRALVTVTGRLVPLSRRDAQGSITAQLAPERITLKADGGSVTVTPDELAMAETDPLAAHEADMLLHLADAHADLTARLTRLVEPRLMQHAIRVLPLAMDRLGISLRVEYARHHKDVRLQFSTRLTCVAQVRVRFAALLAEASRCHRRRLHAEP